MAKKIRVLIVDDSALIRMLLNEILANEDSVEVVAMAHDAEDARDKVKQFSPDVITLDIEMPGMDGLTFLGNLMRLRPMPVVMISTLTVKGADVTIRALELGAVDFVSKPVNDVKNGIKDLKIEIISKIKSAARANILALEHNVLQRQFPQSIKPSAGNVLNEDISLIVIGASTGGTEATKEVLSGLPEKMPPIVIVQHMPEGFTASYSRRLDQLLPFTVQEFSTSGQILKAGNVYVAHGAYHIMVRQVGNIWKGYVEDSDPVNRHKPSVDVLFDSVARSCADETIAVLLTGMGNDGANGMSNMLDAGSTTIAQDQHSSVVWGMPRVAIEQGAAQHELALSEIGQFLVDTCYG